MADGEPGNDQPSLELPKLGLRRRKKAAAPEPPPAAVDETDAAAAAAEETVVLPPAPPPPPAPELDEPPPLFVDEVEPTTSTPTSAPTTEPVPAAAPEPAPVPAALVVDDPPAAPREPRAPRFRRPGGMPAAVLTGVVVGLGMVGLTWAGLRLCETVQGTSSCGGSGYPLLAAILVLMVVVGGLLLKAARVPDPGSTSFLAVGVTAVLALLFLVDSLLDTAMIVVIPLISAGSYALAHWVTRTFIEPAEH